MKKKYDSEQVGRIKRNEEAVNRVAASVSALKEAIKSYDDVSEDIKSLTEYYESSDWKKDFSDDENNLIPKDLKRGVLSEDGIYNLLDEVKELNQILKRDDVND